MRAATEESAISQALSMVGAARDEASVEVIERTDKGVTVRIRPRTDDEPAQDQAPAEPEPIEAQVSDALASEADDEAPELASEEIAGIVSEAAAEGEAEDELFAADDAPSLEQVMEDEAALEPVLFDEAALQETTQQERDDALGEAASTSSSTSSAVAPEVRERARSTAQEMLDRMGLEVSASLSSRPFSAIEAGDPDAESRVYIAVDGADVSILIGKHGATLQSFQYLLNLSLNNRGESSGASGDEAIRVVVDAGGYRARRAEMLERMAGETAERARREGRAIRMESMPAHERRLVHMFLRDDSSISTGSEGREPQRFVVVAPAGQSYEPQRSESRYGSEGYGGRGGYGARGGSGGNRRGRR